MLILAFAALSLGVVLGALLLAGRRRRRLAPVHGLAGLTGLACLAFALWRGALHGPFALDALGLAAAAFAGGIWIYTLASRRLPRPGLLVALHAMAGGLAYLLLAGFVFGR